MPSKERGLGKGLSALLGDAALQEEQAGNPATLPISQIQPGLNQPRKRFDPEAISTLAESIRDHGVIQPITVRRLASGYYQIIAGERRWRAAKEAGLTEVPVHIVEADDFKVMELGLIENLQREDLNPMEEAKGYKTLMEDFGETQEGVARRMGKSRPAIANALRLLTLPDAVQFLLEEGKLSAGHARAILAVPSGKGQKELAQRVVEEDLSVRETEAIAKRMSQVNVEKPKAVREHDLYLTDLEKELSARFGRRVSIQPGKRKSVIQLEYYDLDDLDALLARLRGGSGT